MACNMHQTQPSVRSQGVATHTRAHLVSIASGEPEAGSAEGWQLLHCPLP
jgi:hypothetical protein